VKSGGRGIGIRAGVVGANAAGDAGTAHGREGCGSEGQSGAVIELGDDGPLAEESAGRPELRKPPEPPGVYWVWKGNDVALVEIERRAFGAEIEPVLRDQKPVRCRGRIVDGFSPSVLTRR
jgi:hypothetical protein